RPGIVNLSAGKETSIADVVNALTEITGFRGRIVWDSSRPDGQSRRLFDVGKARRDLGWDARTSLFGGLAKTVSGYRANRPTACNVGCAIGFPARPQRPQESPLVVQ